MTLFVRGTLIDGNPAERAFDFVVPGWRTDGVGNVLKRVTSIAQSRQNLSSGSYHLNVWWFSSIGRTVAGLVPWVDSQTAEFCNYPPVKVLNSQPPNGPEQVHIDLRL